MLPQGTTFLFVHRMDYPGDEENIEVSEWKYHVMGFFTVDDKPYNWTKLIIDVLGAQTVVLPEASVKGRRLDQTKQWTIAYDRGNTDAGRLVRHIGIAVWDDPSAYIY
jgi:hypothetical protein